MSFRRASEARQEESAVLVIPTRERSEAGGICCSCHSDARAKRGRRNLLFLSFRCASEARQEESAVLVIPTRERSEAGGIRCSCHSDARAKRGRRNLLFLSFRRASEARQEESAVLVIPTRERSEAGGICFRRSCCSTRPTATAPWPCIAPPYFERARSTETASRRYQLRKSRSFPAPEPGWK